MLKTVELEDALVNLFVESEELSELSEELLNSLDTEGILQFVHHHAEPVYAYRTDTEELSGCTYRGDMLFTVPAIRITQVKDASCSEPLEFSRTMELWLLQDMSFVAVACVRVQDGERGFSSEYRTIRAREPSQFKSVIDLNYDLLAAIFYCLGQLKSYIPFPTYEL